MVIVAIMAEIEPVLASHHLPQGRCFNTARPEADIPIAPGARLHYRLSGTSTHRRSHPLRCPLPSPLKSGRWGDAMEFGLFHEFQKSGDTSEAEAFAQSFALVDAAEQWGLAAMWLL